MPTNQPEQPEEEPATMRSVVKLISTARPNTIIGGSISDSGGGQPIGDGEQNAAQGAPRKAS